MVNLDDKTGHLLETRAEGEKRSASSYIAILVERDLTAAGLLGVDESANDEAALIAAAADVGGLKEAAVVLKRAARRRKVAHAA